jgi:ribose transport system permease protein
MEASLLSGISVKGVLVAVYTAAGFFSGLAGVILASRLSTGQPTAGTGYELDVIAACVIGGASLTGGRGGILGAVVGALLIGILRNGCNLLDISAFWQQFAIGAIIVIAVLSDQLRQRRGVVKLGT